MKFILGTKQNMTQLFDETGRVYPATVITAGPITVTQIRTKEADKYEAVQVGYGNRKVKNVSKAVVGHIAKALAKDGQAGVADKAFEAIREFRFENETPDFTLGQTIDASVFAPGDTITVAGLTKGKGFQGVVKRHGFGGGRRTHGQKHSEREPGSIGGGGRAGGRVAKGIRMAGRMGSDRVTVKNLTVLSVDAAKNEIVIKGALPGRRGTLLEIIATPVNK